MSKNIDVFQIVYLSQSDEILQGFPVIICWNYNNKTKFDFVVKSDGFNRISPISSNSSFRRLN